MMAAVIRFLKDIFGILVVAYIDDLLIQAVDKQTCQHHAKITILVLQSLGYRVNFEKSPLVTSRVVVHLGFMWDSGNMTISLPRTKMEKISARTGQCWTRAVARPASYVPCSARSKA